VSSTDWSRVSRAAEKVLADGYAISQCRGTIDAVVSGILHADDAQGRAGGTVVQDDGLPMHTLVLLLAAAQTNNEDRRRRLWSLARDMFPVDLLERLEASQAASVEPSSAA
jgi:hypothetical protein